LSVKVQRAIFDGKVTAIVSTPFTLQGASKQAIATKPALSKTRLWLCEEPTLYRLVSVVKDGNSHTTYFGRSQLIIQSTRGKDVITVKATADGLQTSEITITTR
jgi:hypothetical protein